MWPCIVTNFFVIKPNKCTNFTNLFSAWNSICFGQFVCPSSGVYSLYTQQWYMSYSFLQDQDGTAVPSWSCSKAVYKPVWHIPLLSVQRINSRCWTDELSEHVEFRDKINLWMLLVGFITKNVFSNFLAKLCVLVVTGKLLLPKCFSCTPFESRGVCR
jgi:hypothetical protein